MDRRSFLNSTTAAAAGVGLAELSSSPPWAAEPAGGASHAQKLGWRLGCRAYTFRGLTFFEAVDKTRSLGLHYIEIYPGQRLSTDKPGVRIDVSMSADDRKDVFKQLADADVAPASFGICKLSGGEHACRTTFAFAREMGIETLVSEPPFEALELIEGLCGDYGINVAIHNHPKPARYWNPDTVLKHCQGRSKRIGACADTGHWMESGVDPLEAIKKLEGRIISFHFEGVGHGWPVAAPREHPHQIRRGLLFGSLGQP